MSLFRRLSVVVTTATVIVGGLPSFTQPAFACHEPWQDGSVCLAVDECHVLGARTNPDHYPPVPNIEITEGPEVSCFLPPHGP